MDKLYLIISVDDAIKFYQYVGSFHLTSFKLNGYFFLVVPSFVDKLVLDFFDKCGVKFRVFDFS